jgi:hypothetical protein
MNNYKLKKWYPSLPKDWEVGDIVTPSGYKDGIQYYSVSPYAKAIPFWEIQLHPEFWEKVEEKPKSKFEMKSASLMRVTVYKVHEDKVTNKEEILKGIEESVKNGFFEYQFSTNDPEYAFNVKIWLEIHGYTVDYKFYPSSNKGWPPSTITISW